MLLLRDAKLRDELAGKAMQALLGRDVPVQDLEICRGKTPAEAVAHQSYAMADAMLKERVK